MEMIQQSPSNIQDLETWLLDHERHNPCLEVTFAKAKLYRNTQTITKMNPYLVIKVGRDLNVRTHTVKNGGKNPIWNHRMTIPIAEGFE